MCSLRGDLTRQLLELVEAKKKPLSEEAQQKKAEMALKRKLDQYKQNEEEKVWLH